MHRVRAVHRPRAPTVLLHALLLSSAIAAVLPPADADAQGIRIVELFTGTATAPSAQYVVLQMFGAGQGDVLGKSLIIYDTTGVETGRFTFAANMANQADQARVLIATAQAETFFAITADLIMTGGRLNAAGGRVCLDADDCMSWSANTGDRTGSGTPFNSPLAALRSGVAVARNIAGGSSATALDGGDDSDDSAADFVFATPTPINNADTPGTIPASACGNSAVEGLERCDDGNTMGMDACRADCAPGTCGDAIVDTPPEFCDDGNLQSGDGCRYNCTVELCGDGVADTSTVPGQGEQCDDGNSNDLDGCRNCAFPACGDGFLDTSTIAGQGEACDDGNILGGDGCSANCTIEECGDNVVDPQEQCDDGNNLNGDGCRADCTAEICGDAVIDTASESCDDGNTSNGDGCRSD